MTDSIWSGQTGVAYPLRSLAAAGTNLLFGSDAPVAPLDPWAAMAAAVFRTRDGRPAWRPDEALDAGTALAASTAGGSFTRATLMPGDLADLVVVDRDPLAVNETALRGTQVQATLLEGRLTFLA